MNQHEAEDLAGRISQTPGWRTGAHEWVSHLLDLDAGRAGTALVRMQRELEHTPSIPKFLEYYRALRTETPHDTGCILCDHTGWKRITQHSPACTTPNDRLCQALCHDNGAVTPCNCRNAA